MTELVVQMTYLPGADENVPLPAYETAGAAGMDLRANFPGREALSLAAGARALIPTGLALAIPQGFEAQIRPRSGLALKHGVTVVNTPGTIDSDYRGPLGIILINHGSSAFEIGHGERIAQIVFAPVVQAEVVLAERLGGTTRGASGFGSTGRR